VLALLHPFGNTFVRAVLSHSELSGELGVFATSLGFVNPPPWSALLPASMQKELLRRRYEIPPEKLVARPWKEVLRLLSSRLHSSRLTRHETGYASVDAVFKDLDLFCARHLAAWKHGFHIDTVYAYEDGALASFEKAQSLGLARVYDLPIVYWKTLKERIAEESERLPEWACTLGGGIHDSEQKRERKDQELALAEAVVVPSHFVARSLPSWATGTRVLAPFGSPAPLSSKEAAVALQGRAERRKKNRPLRVLFAGSMGQRKGLGDLMTAVRNLGRSDVELVVMGSPMTSQSFYERQCPGFRFEAGRPHSAVLELMSQCDVFCLPSIAEGRALVMQEAMSQGLPVIITPNTGGEDLIEEGRTGFLVPIRSPEKIAEKLSWMADHREELEAMSQAAMEKAAEYTWESYGHAIESAVHELLQTRHNIARVHA
jgi:glycosyltransferase involved in cell wall biosynthesis